jgi:DNA-binding transcriptional ArsR family regulator
MKPYQDITDPALAKALAHPLRTRILAALENRTASPSELAEELGASLGVLSYHVRRLTALGFLKLVKRVPRRGAVEHYYTAVARPRITDEAWGATPAIVKEATLRAALDQIGGIVRGAAIGGGFDPPEAHLSRAPVVVDREGWLALAGELQALMGRVQQIEVESRGRLELSDHAGERAATVVLMLFGTPPEPPSDGVSAPSRRRSRGPAHTSS